jgi:hypothetical protein
MGNYGKNIWSHIYFEMNEILPQNFSGVVKLWSQVMVSYLFQDERNCYDKL